MHSCIRHATLFEYRSNSQKYTDASFSSSLLGQFKKIDYFIHIQANEECLAFRGFTGQARWSSGAPALRYRGLPVGRLRRS